jgi:hypothetical protein
MKLKDSYHMSSAQAEAYLQLTHAITAYDKAPCSATLGEMARRAADMALQGKREEFTSDALVAVLMRVTTYMEGVKPPVLLPDAKFTITKSDGGIYD